jgi:hypothetical protein
MGIETTRIMAYLATTLLCSVPILAQAQQPPEAVLDNPVAVLSPYGQFVSQNMSLRNYLHGTHRPVTWRQADAITYVEEVSGYDPVTKTKSEILIVFTHIQEGKPFVALTRIVVDGKDLSPSDRYQAGIGMAVEAQATLKEPKP